VRLAVPYRNLPTRYKLHLIIMVTVGAALLLACGAILTYDYFAFRATMRNDLSILADMFGANSTAALSFGDEKAEQELLASLQAKRSILAAVVYSADGKQFAVYNPGRAAGVTAPSGLRTSKSWFAGNRLMLYRPILL